MDNGTMEHLTDTKLEKYLARELSAADTTAVILHLDTCPDCFRKLQNISAAVDASNLFFAGDAEMFHLDYDEHLRPFIDNEASAATREIVEGHAQACASCAFQLRELREFSESLRFRQSSNPANNTSLKTIFSAKIRLLLTGLTKRANFQTISILVILTLLGFLTYFTVGKFKSAENIETANPILPEKQIISSPETLNKKTEIADDTARQNADQIPPQEVVSKNNLPPVSEPTKPSRTDFQAPQNENREVAELGKLPETLRLDIRQALESRRLNLPPVLQELSANIKLRGNGETPESKTIISPNKEVIASDRPIFQWRRAKDAKEKFTVEIFDDENNSVAVSQGLTKNSWKPEKPLQRGKIYLWELRSQTAENPAAQTIDTGKFKILDAQSKAQLEKLPPNASPILRGIFLASKGLITEARKEFQKAKRTSPRSPAKNFMRQLKK